MRLSAARLMSLGERLREARSSLKLTLDAVAQQSGLGISTISKFEGVKREPRIGQLKKLADAYHRPASYFLDEAVPPVESVLWRERPPSPTAEQMQARLIELADQYHTLEALCDQGSDMDLARYEVDAKRFGFPAAGRLAHRVRNDLGLEDRPGQALLRVLEEVCNVEVFHLDFEPSGTAACTLADRYGVAVLLNSRIAPWRRTFDLAHELFHPSETVRRYLDQLRPRMASWDQFVREMPSERPSRFLALAVRRFVRG